MIEDVKSSSNELQCANADRLPAISLKNERNPSLLFTYMLTPEGSQVFEDPPMSFKEEGLDQES